MSDTPRGVRIRRHRLDDAAAHRDAALESVAEIHPWMPWCHAGYAIEEASGWIAQSIENWEKDVAYEFLIVDEDDRMLGACGLNQLRIESRIANLGYWVRTSATRRGVATAAVRLLAAYALEHTDLDRLELVIAVGNRASERVAEKLGAIREGLAHDRLRLHGRAHDAHMFAILRSRWMERD